MNSDDEIYPMPMFDRLEVSDVTQSTEWYRDVLGFGIIFQMPGLTHLRYRKYADILLVPSEAEIDPDGQGRGVDIYFTVESETVADIAERAKQADTIVEGPSETAHNTREVVIADPDGYTLVFTEPVDPTRTFEDVTGVEFEP
ncbi:VOC family protein [Halosolutus gelatinilyticus]|uniref:VOC family protein n=1 Tax=Halosolutus gelatinilyticus TaxID=2931975 RepID=UPI001FF1A139|nr:VOC family protein [Halosolutus gelatinilyticus]